MLDGIYGASHPSFARALETFHKTLAEHRDETGVVMSGHEVALRWLRHHSALSGACGDAIVFGARTEAQLEETLKALEGGPLPAVLVQAVERCYEEVKGDVPYFSPFRVDEKAWARS